MEPSSLKKQHGTGAEAIKGAPVCSLQPSAYVPDATWAQSGCDAVDTGPHRWAQLRLRSQRDTFILPRMLCSQRLSGWVGTILGTAEKTYKTNPCQTSC